jgi:hypothetical protein
MNSEGIILWLMIAILIILILAYWGWRKTQPKERKLNKITFLGK